MQSTKRQKQTAVQQRSMLQHHMQSTMPAARGRVLAVTQGQRLARTNAQTMPLLCVETQSLCLAKAVEQAHQRAHLGTFTSLQLRHLVAWISQLLRNAGQTCIRRRTRRQACMRHSVQAQAAVAVLSAWMSSAPRRLRSCRKIARATQVSVAQSTSTCPLQWTLTL